MEGRGVKYNVKFTRVIEGQIEASSLEEAARAARAHVAQIPNAKLLSILPGGYVDPDSKPPVGPRSPDAPTPGTPVVKQDVLVDQIAKAA